MYDQFLKQLRILPVLVIVASLAFAVRLGEIVVDPHGSRGAAVAQDKPMTETSMESEDKMKTEPKLILPDDPMPPPSSIDWQDSDENDIGFSSVKAELFETLTKRRKDLDAREYSVERKEALLKAAEHELDRKYKELEKIRDELQALLHQQTEEEKSTIRRLVKIYEGMKAKDAAKIFNTLDMDILIDVTSNMSERKLAPVMASMDPDRARSVTVFLAEEKSLPTLPDQ